MNAFINVFKLQKWIIVFLFFTLIMLTFVWDAGAKDQGISVQSKTNTFCGDVDFEVVAYNKLTDKLSEIKFNHILMRLIFQPPANFIYSSKQAFKSHLSCLEDKLLHKGRKSSSQTQNREVSIWPRAWFGLSREVAPSGIATTIQLFFHKEASKLGLCFKPLNYPLELQNQSKRELLGLWPEAQIMCTFSFPF